jgi:hypothetical protein
MTSFSLIRNVPKKNRQNQNKAIQPNNNRQTMREEVIDDNAPDYLPYSLYSKLSPFQQKPQEDVIHPVESSHAANPKQPSQKPRKRHSRPLKLTGEVNLGTDKLRAKKHKQRPIHVEETVTNAGRHHHHPNDIPEVETTSTTTTQEPTEAPIEETTQASIVVERTTMTEAKRKLEEKAQRRERLKEKLKALTPEERQAFLLMKQQRADAKKKGLIIAN